MTMRSVALAVVLVAMQGGALAQTGQEPDPNCPLKDGLLKQQFAPGRITIMTVKNKGNKDCRGTSDCTNEVEAQSFNRANGEAACCTRIEWASMTALKGNHQVPLKWKLKAVDGKSYVFNPSGIYVIPPPLATPDDLGSLKLTAGSTVATIKSVNKRGGAITFNYGASVSLKRQDGTYLACDQNDPVIVNQGN